jgi:hypothetical protein
MGSPLAPAPEPSRHALAGDPATPARKALEPVPEFTLPSGCQSRFTGLRSGIVAASAGGTRGRPGPVFTQ